MCFKNRAAQSDFVPGSAFSTPKLCLVDEKQAQRSSPAKKLCIDRSIAKAIAACQSEISDFGQNQDQMLYL